MDLPTGLPAGFTAIKDAIYSFGETVSLLGIVTTIREPYKSRGDDWVLDFKIQDEFTPDASSGPSIRCKFFRRDPSRLPVGAVGDPVIVRRIKLSEFMGEAQAISSSRDSSELLFFPTDKVPVPELSTPYGYGGQSKLLCNKSLSAPGPSFAEQQAIIRIKALAAPSTASIKQHSATSTPLPTHQDKRALIRDVELRKYHDLVVEVVKMYYEDNRSLDIYVSDYTVNRDLFLYEDPALAGDGWSPTGTKWKGPFGQTTMAIRLWDPHAAWVRANVHEGDFIHVNDVHIKLSQANKLEGALHEDQRYRDKVKVRKVTSAREIDELQRRKRAYLEKYEQEHAAEPSAPGAKKPSAKASARKKEEKKERERQKKLQEQRELEKKAEENAVYRAGINAHVRAGYPHIQRSTFDEILHNSNRKAKSPQGVELELPFVNTKYRTRLRVVDFTPLNLEEFCRSMADPDWNVALREPVWHDRRRDDRWQWAFVLLVEEADVPKGSTPGRFPLFVCDDSAQYLLKMNALDLTKDPHGAISKKLEEKLFILWGNLLELKKELTPKGVQFPLPSGDERLQNKPFECCIEEYGAKVAESPQWPRGWQRMLKLASTTIMDD